jgi:Cdc6-like AAA superfamily ATPase
MMPAMSVAPSLSTEIDLELRRPLIRELRAALDRTQSSQSGEVVFCRGQPGSGRTTVLQQFLAELGPDAKDTDVLAGGFARPGSDRGSRCGGC